jgi:hypothetical protein
MSPLEAKSYGLIDHIVGGDDAVFKVDGSTRAFPKTKEQYVNWGDDDFLDGSRGSRCARQQGSSMRLRLAVDLAAGAAGVVRLVFQAAGFDHRCSHSSPRPPSPVPLPPSAPARPFHRFVKPLEPHTEKVSTNRP